MTDVEHPLNIGLLARRPCSSVFAIGAQWRAHSSILVFFPTAETVYGYNAWQAPRQKNTRFLLRSNPVT